MLALDNLEFISYSEEGAQICGASWQGSNVIVKKCDIWNLGMVVEELKHEVRAYQVLQKLQWNQIPILKLAGIVDGMEMVLVTEFVGTNIRQEQLSRSDKIKIRDAFSAIHSLGVLHGDIRLQNILVQSDGRVRRFTSIDFGLPQFTTDKQKLQREAEVLAP
ncbi:hypothetical protein EC991_007590 [Linnemannia zychae]|nr:hypothetical protein EC991_007590 [Linnemannia zychae]